MDLKAIRQAIASIGDQRKSLAAQLEEKKRRREFLENAPLPKDELVAGLCTLIDRDAALYPAGLRKSIEGLLRKPFHDWRASHLNLLGTVNGVTLNEGRFPRQLVAFAFSDILKKAIERAVDDWDDYPEPGPPMAERRAEIQRLDKEIEKLEHQVAEIDDEAKAAGIKRLEG